MPKLGELSVEELVDGAEKDAAYLGQRLEQLAAQRAADPDDIKEVITRALITNIRSRLIVATSRLREQHKTS